jgi:rhodanese-related sulfurtransferase
MSLEQLPPLIPSIGDVSQAERMFRVNWLDSIVRSPRGVPMLSPEFVAMQGRSVRLVDLRTSQELLGPLGYIPGVDWVPRELAGSLVARLGMDDPLVLISRGGERAAEVAEELEAAGMRYVASLEGGMVAWKKLGFATIREPSLLTMQDVLRIIEPAVSAGKQALSAEQIEDHIGDPFSVRWMKLASLMLFGCQSCVDGRDETGIIGTPGGDAGEFLLALSALEGLTGEPLTDAQLRALIARRVDTFGHFYMHTDISAANTLIKSMRADRRMDAALEGVFETMEWRRFYASPPEAVRPVVLEHALDPAHIGCGHVRLMMQHASDYGVRRELTDAFLRSFMSLRWDGIDELALKPLPGGHEEGAVVNVLIEGGVAPWASIPLVSPACGGTQMFVNHPQVSDFLREQLASFLCAQDDVITVPEGGADALCLAMCERAQSQLMTTLGHLASGLPIYNVTFLRRGGFTVELVGVV